MEYRLKKIKNAVKHRNLPILRRPQFIGRNIHRGRYMKPLELDENKISLTPPPIDVDATTDILIGFSTPFGFLTGMGSGPTLARVSNRMTMALLKAIKERAAKMAELREKP